MEPLSPQHVQDALDQSNLGLKIVPYDTETPTSELAAQAIGCEVAQIAKSICFMVDGAPILVVASGTNQVDDRKVAGLLGVGRKKVKLAKADECISIFGYAPGGVPPIGHRVRPAHIFLDQDLQRFDRIYAAGGSDRWNFGMEPSQLKIISGGMWVEVAKERDA